MRGSRQGDPAHVVERCRGRVGGMALPFGPAAAGAVCIASLACTYGPPEPSATVEQIVRLGDSYHAVVLVRHDVFRRPTGLSAFPDGGKWRYTLREATLYLVDAGVREIRWLHREAASDEVWESFGAWVVGAQGDSVVYVRLTGCPRGGQCHPALQRKQLYRLSTSGRRTSVEAVPSGSALPGTMYAPGPGERHYVRFGVDGDVITARFEADGRPEELFRLRPDGSLVIGEERPATSGRAAPSDEGESARP